MYFRPATLVLFTVLLLASGSGCKKNKSVAPSSLPTALSPDTAASIHWLGKHELGYEATAFFFMRIWNLPQAVQLEKQTLTKLATTPGQWLPNGTHLTTDVVKPLWMLLNDLVQQESYLEIRAATNSVAATPSSPGLAVVGEVGRETSQLSTLNSQPSFTFAIRLNPAQTESWLTNLPAVLQPLTGARVLNNPMDHTWSLKTTNVLNVIRLAHVGEWTVLSAGPEQNSLAGEIVARIRRDGVPFVSSGTNLWLEAAVDFPRLAQVFSNVAATPSSPSFFVPSVLNSQFSTLNFSITGDGGTVIERARLEFARPFSTPLEPWRLPVELMHEPLTSFTAMRGLQSNLNDWAFWRDLEMDTAPDQLFTWSLGGSPYQIYLAAPSTDARSQVVTLSNHLLQNANPWLATNGYISFDRAADGNGVTWGNLTDIKPFIKSAGSDGWLLAGLLPDTNNAAAPPPAGLIQDVLRRTNLVYYDWEVTGPRLQPALQVAQTVRQVTRRPELAMDSAGINWLAMLIPRLGTSVTLVNRTGPTELTFYRRSTLGFNAVELHLLADWLESPQFPR
ncbi:MAG: hypothetical protein WDM80_07375 [Limisphaerales bacterium]